MLFQRNRDSFRSRARPLVQALAFISLGSMAACANPPAADSPKAGGVDQASGPKPSPTAPNTTERKATNRLTAGGKDATLGSQPVAEPKEADMTVLVLEDHDLLALAARTAPPITLPPEPAVAAEAIQRPELSQFRFEFGSHRLPAEADQALREHARYLGAHPEQKVYITGHSDSQGAEAYNRSLSRLRAAAAARVLREGGVREKQMEVTGVGSDFPAVPGDHSANRRVELSYRDAGLALSN